MPAPKKDNSGGGGAKNGNRGSFRTDAAISNSRNGGERLLQKWMPDANDTFDGSLENSSTGGTWDQFAENERLFGLKTDYDENIYTTAINKNHPQYRERIAAAERKAREIERSTAATSHVAEERVMDYVAGKGQADENEEDKYSGVRRQDFPPLSSGRENRYTPPAKRAPTGQTSVQGAPVDPAIISSQIKVPNKKQQASSPAVESNGVAQAALPKSTEEKSAEATSVAATSAISGVAGQMGTPARTTPSTSRNLSPQVKEGTPSATSTVERDVLKEFKNFASQQRESAQKIRTNKAKADKEVKLTELKKFASTFKLSTPVPTDLVSIIAKDPAKQKEIQAKAIKNAEEVAHTKTVEDKTVRDAQPKPAETSNPKPQADARVPRGPGAGSGNQSGQGSRQHGHRQPYQQQYQQQYRNNNRGGPHIPQSQTGTLSSRLRNLEQQKWSQPPAQDGRAPPTGPANPNDPNFNRRISGVPTHMGPKLNPNTQEFRPSPFAAAFNPNNQQSTASSPRSALAVNGVESPAGGQLIRRKTKAVDVNKCRILSHIKTIKPPQGRNWDDNGGLRPSYDTLPTWRQLQDEEKPDSTMHLTYTQLFERQPFGGSSMATPNPSHVVPHIPHQHQLPFHLQQGAHMGPRQSPHMPHMQMHNPQHGPGPHPPYGHDDHRMLHSNSAQSFASPALGQVAMAGYPGMNSPAQMPYNQPVYMGPGGAPQMGYRSFSNNQQYMGPQQGQMGGPMMMGPQFMPGPQGMVGAPQMMYAGHPHFMPPGGPPQGTPGANGYSSPGRPAAPMMAHQGSQQGQPMYGMSPSVQYSQPATGYSQGQSGGPSTVPNPRGYSNGGPQHYGTTSPHQGNQYGGQQQRNGNNNYNKGHNAQQQIPQVNHSSSAATGADQVTQNRASDVSKESK